MLSAQPSSAEDRIVAHIASLPSGRPAQAAELRPLLDTQLAPGHTADDPLPALLADLVAQGRLVEVPVHGKQEKLYWLPRRPHAGAPAMQAAPATPSAPIADKEKLLEERKSRLRAEISSLTADLSSARASCADAELALARVLHPDLPDPSSAPLDLDAAYRGYIKRLHAYNETRDLGQVLLGLLGTAEQTTTRVMYERYGLDLDD